MKLNIGCCDRAFPGFVSVDLVPPADQLVNLAEPWPWQDSSVEEIRAWDIIEHIGDCNHMGWQWCETCVRHRGGMPFGQKIRDFRGSIHVMNEAHRVLRPGGRFDIIVPTTDGRGAWQDPGHVSFWNRNSFLYFTHGDAHLTRFAPANGVQCAYRVIEEQESMHPGKVSKLHIVLEAVK